MVELIVSFVGGYISNFHGIQVRDFHEQVQGIKYLDFFLNVKRYKASFLRVSIFQYVLLICRKLKRNCRLLNLGKRE